MWFRKNILPHRIIENIGSHIEKELCALCGSKTEIYIENIYLKFTT